MNKEYITKHNKPSTGDVIPDLCIFCDTDKKKMKGYWVLPGRYEKYDAEMTIRDAAILVDNNIKLRLGNHYF